MNLCEDGLKGEAKYLFSEERLAVTLENMREVKKFLRDQLAQDSVEYTLVLAFVILASASLYTGAGRSSATILGNPDQSANPAWNAWYKAVRNCSNQGMAALSTYNDESGVPVFSQCTNTKP
jgi:hypothetical protein